MEKYLETQLLKMTSNIQKLEKEVVEESRLYWNTIAKPLYGFGDYETIITKIAGIQKSLKVNIEKKAVVVFCADNGVVEEGISQAGQSVTAAVAENIASGRGEVNHLAKIAGADVITVDVGVAEDLKSIGVYNHKLRYGTHNFCKEEAMSRKEALELIHVGIQMVSRLKDAGYQMLAVGEMGIGNTTTSSAIASVLLEQEVEAVTGVGAGLSKEGLSRKISAIKKGIELHKPQKEDPIGVLSSVGGFDIAGMTGLLLGGGIYGLPIVLDGMIALTAALLAKAIAPNITEYLIPSHLGKEPVCQCALDALELHPTIHANMGIGEGTGAVMLFPHLDMVADIYNTFFTFEQHEIETYENFKGEETQ